MSKACMWFIGNEIVMLSEISNGHIVVSKKALFFFSIARILLKNFEIGSVAEGGYAGAWRAQLLPNSGFSRIYSWEHMCLRMFKNMWG
jgi:hypothetical protein